MHGKDHRRCYLEPCTAVLHGPAGGGEVQRTRLFAMVCCCCTHTHTHTNTHTHAGGSEMQRTRILTMEEDLMEVISSLLISAAQQLEVCCAVFLCLCLSPCAVCDSCVRCIGQEWACLC